MSAISHLPPGHPPGRQTRRGRRGFGFGVTGLIVVAVAAAIGAVLLLVLGVAGVVKGGAAGGGGGVCAFAALLFGGFARYAWRANLPPRLRGVELEVDGTELRRGEKVVARVSIPDVAALDGQVEIGLVCTVFHDVREESVNTRPGALPGSRDHWRSIKSADVVERWHTARRDPGEQLFELEVPAGAPYSYEGDCLSIAWRVSVRRRHARGFGGASRDRPIWVSP